MSYTASVTSLMSKVERISRSLGVFCGKCNVSGYNSTLIAITGITKHFIDVAHTGAAAVDFRKGPLAVIPNGLSDNGHMFEWDSTKGAFKCYKPTQLQMDDTIVGDLVIYADPAGGTGYELHATTALDGVARVGVAAEVADTCDAGEITFTAIGFIR